MTANTVDPAEISKFSDMAAEWWDPEGKFMPLHRMNPVRLDYMVAHIAAEFGRDRRAPRPLQGLSLVDVGCGGGLLAEPMARLGADVTGVDAGHENIAVARLHAAEQGLGIDYRATTAEALAAEGARFDVLLCSEVIEHVSDTAALLRACRDLIRPGGLMIGTTLNRTTRSFGAAILGAEWLLGWLPRGTHDWSRFVTPDEFYRLMEGAGIDPLDRAGFVFNPVTWGWSLSHRDLAVNYAVTGRVPQGAS